MADYNQAYKITMINEGGYADNPNDHGGKTYMGISYVNNPDWAGWARVNNIVENNPDNYQHVLAADTLLQTQVRNFYKPDYWDCLQLDSVNCQQIANQLFDASVNNGQHVAAILFQTGVNQFTNGSFKVDGIIGSLSVRAINNISNNEQLYNAINSLRSLYYRAICIFDRSRLESLTGWLNRLIPFNAPS